MRLRLWMLAWPLALAGCDFAPEYHRPDVAMPVKYEEAGDWADAHPADELPRGAWWRMYGDAQLDRLEAQVDSGNPTLAAAAAAYQQARSMALEAEADLFPTAGAGAAISANRKSSDSPMHSFAFPGSNDVDLQASYELDFWGSVRDAAKAGRDEAQAAEDNLETIRLTLHAELASDYFALRGLDEETKLLTDTVESYEQGYELTKILYEGKIASGIDVTRAQAQLDAARAQVSDTSGRRALLEHAIATLAGKPPAEVSIAPAVVHETLPQIPFGLPSALLERRPDVAAAERLAAAANERIGVARAAFFPSFSLGAMIGHQSNTLLNLANAPSEFWTVGPSMTLPLFEGGRLRANLAATKAMFEQSSQTYRATVLNAFREVEDDLAQLRWIEKEKMQEESAAAAAQKTADLAMILYRNGTDSYLDVVTAQTTALAAQRAVLSLNTRQIEASVALIRALGGGWTTASAEARPASASEK